jgi:hypothetical protein
MGSTNFQFFNPTETNQETDAEWLADSIRAGGVAVDDILPSPFLNKLWYQANNGVTALMTMMANKGFTTLDTNLATLTAVLANLLTTADVPLGLQVLSWSPTLALDASRYAGFQVTLGGVTSVSITGQAAGALIALLWVQDGTGGRTVTFSGSFSGAAQPDPTPGVTSCQLFKVNAALILEALTPAVSVAGMGGMAIGAVNPAPGNFSALTCPTRPLGDNTTNAATTAFIKAAITASYTSGSNANGYWQKDANGKIQQWGRVATDINGGSLPVSFPVPFANAVSISVVVATYSVTDRITYVQYGSISTTGFTIANNGSQGYACWQAVGY